MDPVVDQVTGTVHRDRRHAAVAAQRVADDLDPGRRLAPQQADLHPDARGRVVAHPACPSRRLGPFAGGIGPGSPVTPQWTVRSLSLTGVRRCRPCGRGRRPTRSASGEFRTALGVFGPCFGERPVRKVWCVNCDAVRAALSQDGYRARGRRRSGSGGRDARTEVARSDVRRIGGGQRNPAGRAGGTGRRPAAPAGPARGAPAAGSSRRSRSDRRVDGRSLTATGPSGTAGCGRTATSTSASPGS